MPTPASRSGRAPALPPEERRRAIVDAVTPLLLEHGASVTTRQLAHAAGVAEGTLFRAFPDKAALLHAAAHAVLDPARVRRGLADLDHRLPLDAVVRDLVARLLERTGQVTTVMMALRSVSPGGPGAPPGPPASLHASHRALLDGLTEVLTRYRTQLRVEPERAALLLRALTSGARPPWGAGDDPLTADELATTLLTGLAAAPTRASPTCAAPTSGETPC